VIVSACPSGLRQTDAPYSFRRMRYLSTRDARPQPATSGFEAVLLAGLAGDGGLYVPQSLPALDAAALRGLAGLSYAELAARIVALFAGEAFTAAELRGLTEAAYGTFGHAAVAPLVQLDERLWLLELFHGPTLAFKDLALQLLGRLFDAVLARQREQVTIIGATSGDTGSAGAAPPPHPPPLQTLRRRSPPAATAPPSTSSCSIRTAASPRCSAGR
jgi:threonine synthase